MIWISYPSPESADDQASEGGAANPRKLASEPLRRGPCVARGEAVEAAEGGERRDSRRVVEATSRQAGRRDDAPADAAAAARGRRDDAIEHADAHHSAWPAGRLRLPARRMGVPVQRVGALLVPPGSMAVRAVPGGMQPVRSDTRHWSRDRDVHSST